MVGQGKQSPHSVKTVLEAKSRQAAPPPFMTDALLLRIKKHAVDPQLVRHCDP